MDIACGYINIGMFIGIDDTDSPQGMFTTYLGAVLIRRLVHEHMQVHEARLVRLNPNVTWKTRGNAAVSLHVKGDEKTAFDIACATVEELADFSCENTNPGVVVTGCQPGPAFYRKAVTDFCQVEEAIEVLEAAGARYRGYKNKRGIIGATAAVASELSDTTSEILVYRQPEQWGTTRYVDRASLFAAEETTFPHTWDTVDKANDVVVCVPHTPDPVLFGIRGESPSWVMIGRQMIQSEKTGIEQIWVTNQGTDAHILSGRISELQEGLSYRIRGVVKDTPSTLTGGHVSFTIEDNNHSVRCMAYEPTKNFRPIVRQLVRGDEITAFGSYKKGSINLEKIGIRVLAEPIISRPPLCTTCNKRMTSDGTGKGFKCKKCGIRANDPEIQKISRTLKHGWYEVPPTARRHLAKPLCRGMPEY
jgi:tRNA(Ile2)-agmatinylcytidine synthase